MLTQQRRQQRPLRPDDHFASHMRLLSGGGGAAAAAAAALNTSLVHFLGFCQFLCDVRGLAQWHFFSRSIFLFLYSGLNQIILSSVA